MNAITGPSWLRSAPVGPGWLHLFKFCPILPQLAQFQIVWLYFLLAGPVSPHLPCLTLFDPVWPCLGRCQKHPQGGGPSFLGAV